MMHLVGSCVGRTVYPFTTFDRSYRTTAGYVKGMGLNDSKENWELANDLRLVALPLGPDENSFYRHMKGITVEGNMVDANWAAVTTSGWDTAEIKNNRFTKGKFFEIWDATQDDPRMMYIACRDFMNGSYINGMERSTSGWTGLAASTTNTKNAAASYLKDVLGWNPLIDYDNFADIETGGAPNFSGLQRLGLALIPKESGGIIATFNRGLGDSPRGVNSVTPGSDHYVNSFFEGGTVDASIARLSILAESLDSMRHSLYTFMDNSFFPKFYRGGDLTTDSAGGPGRNQDSDDSFFRMQQSDDPYRQGPHIAKYYTTKLAGTHLNGRWQVTAAHLTQWVIQEMNGVLRQLYLRYMTTESLAELANMADDVALQLQRNHSAAWMGLQAVAGDSDCAWAGFKYILARDLYRRNKMGAQKFMGWCLYFAQHIAAYFELEQQGKQMKRSGEFFRRVRFGRASVYDNDPRTMVHLWNNPMVKADDIAETTPRC